MTVARQTLADAYRPEANNLNLIRLVLAVMVIASHSYVVALGQDGGVAAEPLGRLTHHRTELGSVAVDGFFAVSGFLLAASWGRGHGLGHFAVRRFLRIYPGFLVCVLACVFLVGTVSVDAVGPYLRDSVTYRLLRYLYFGPFMDALPGAFPRNPQPEIVNTSLWTIKFEVECYVLLMALGVTRLLRPDATLILAGCALVGFVTLSLSGRLFGHVVNPYYMPRLVTCFLLGSAAYSNRSRIPMTWPLLVVAVVLLVTTVRLPVWPCLVLPTAGLYCLLYVACLNYPPTNAFGRRTDLSYGVYLYAYPVQQLVVSYGMGRGRPWVLTALTMPLVLAIAWASWTFVERPALRVNPRAFRRRTADAANAVPTGA